MLTTDEAIRLYLKERELSGAFTTTTLANARSHLGMFAQWCEIGNDGVPMDVAEITGEHVERWVSSVKVSKGTVRNRISSLRSFFKWARRRGLTAADPMDGVKPPPRERSVPRSFDGDIVARILDACSSNRDRLIISLMVQEGLRCCGVANLRMQDVDLAGDELLVVEKGGHERMLPLTVGTKRVLLAYLAELEGSAFGPLLRKLNNPSAGLTANWVSKVVRRVLTDAGVKHLPGDGVSAHALRHTAASDVYEQCGDLQVVKEMLGHASIMTTQIYLRSTAASRLRAAMEGRRYTVPDTAA